MKIARSLLLSSAALGLLAVPFVACSSSSGSSTPPGTDASIQDAPSGDDALAADGADAGSVDASDAGVNPCANAPNLGPSGTALAGLTLNATGTIGDVASAVGADGSIYVTATLNGSLAFPGSSTITTQGFDVVLLKFDAAGAFQWGKAFGDAASQAGSVIAVDGNGNVDIGGYYLGSLDFGGADAGLDLTTGGGTANAFVAQFDAQGQPRWARAFGDGTSENVSALATDKSGNIVAGIYLQGTVSIALPDGGTTMFTSAGQGDILLLDLTASGVVQGGRRYGDANDQVVDSLAFDSAGNIIAAGTFGSDLSFSGRDAGAGVFSNPGLFQGFAAKLSPTGDFVWGDAFGNGDGYQGYTIAAVDPSDDIIIGASTSGAVQFAASDAGPGAFAGIGKLDAYVAKYDKNGVFQWANHYGDANQAQSITGLTSDPGGNIVFGGNYEGTINLDTGDASAFTSQGGTDVFLGKLGPGGSATWAISYGTAGEEYLTSLSAFKCGAITATGEYSGTNFTVPAADGGAVDIAVAGDSGTTQGYLLQLAP